jgi:hypothetical protein
VSSADPVVRPERGPRGRVWLYAIAFVVLLVSGWLQVKGNLASNFALVRWSIVLSTAAVLIAVASVVVPGPRLLPAPATTDPAPETDGPAPPRSGPAPDDGAGDAARAESGDGTPSAS